MKQTSYILLLCYSIYGFTQDGSFSLGARNSGLAGASVTIHDQWSLFNNVGGLGKIKNHSAFASYQNRYGISEFQVSGAGAIYATKTGVAGIGFFKFGNDLFSQQRIHLGVGHQLQLVSLGVGIDLIQYNVSTIGTKQVFSLQFGGIVNLTKHLQFGAHLFNLNQAEVSEESQEKLPTVMKGGLSYRPNHELMINLEVEKDLAFDETIKAGIEYQIIRRLFLRTGVSTKPMTHSFGLGFKPKKYQIDYAYIRNSALGAIHEVSTSVHFNKKQ